MAHRKLTPEEFREDFDVYVSEFNLAHDVITYLDEALGAGAVQAARRLLQAKEDFDEALSRAGILSLDDLAGRV